MPTHKDLPMSDFEQATRQSIERMKNFVLVANGVIEANLDEAFSLGVDQVVIDVMGAEDDLGYVSKHFTTTVCCGVVPRNERAGKFLQWMNKKKLLL